MNSTRVISYLNAAAGALADKAFDKAKAFERLADEESDKTGPSPSELHAQVRMLTGDRLAASGDKQGAREAYEGVLAQRAELGLADRGTYDAHYKLAGVLRQLGDGAGALKELNEALLLSDRLFGEKSLPSLNTRVSLASTLVGVGRNDEAITVLRAARDNCEAMIVPNPRQLALINEALAAVKTQAGKDSSAVHDVDNAAASMSEAQQHRAAEEKNATRAKLAEELEVIDGPAEPENVDDILKEMDEQLVGLDDIKAKMRRKADFLRVQVARQEAGLATKRQPFHVLLIGPSGTGKTTVASYLGRICFALGLLKTGKVVTATRANMVRGYIGQTAIRTNEIVDFALDGVLFLDEAYALAKKDSGNDFGGEAISELLMRMTDDADRLVVAAAGYEREMREFIETNTGFRSRFTDELAFHDYSDKELLEIFIGVVADNGYELDDDARAAAGEIITALWAARDEYFGNARAMNNLFTDVIEHQASRLIDAGGDALKDKQALALIHAADIQAQAQTVSAPTAASATPA